LPEVIFVGAGPGDPELITVKGLQALREADVVIFAGSLVNPALLREVRPGAAVHDSAPLTLEQVLELIFRAVAEGKRVVRLHTGDPSIYGAIQEQMEALSGRGIPCRVIPGVTAAFAAAASLKQELTLPGVSQTVILTRIEGRTAVPEKERLHRIAALGATVCLYLSVGLIEEVVAELLAGGAYRPETPAVVVSRTGWEDELTIEGSLSDIAARVAAAGINRQAVIIVGEVLAARHEGVPERSKLYDPEFGHGYRK
jgi:precorrin-4/cobalt-precorrin-4 C11-methyltransferase